MAASTSNAHSKHPRTTRTSKFLRRGLFAGAMVLLLGAPFLWVYYGVYRANLAVTRIPSVEEQPLISGDRVLVISPHPDDETLGAAGLMYRAHQMKLPVRLVFLTNGDGSQSTRLYENLVQLRRFPNRPDTYVRLAQMRQAEALAAAGRVGTSAGDVRFLGYPDGGLRALWNTNWLPDRPYRSVYTALTASPYANSPTRGAIYCGQAALGDLVTQLREFRPTLVLTTHPADTHPDHHAAYDMTVAALELLRAEPAEQPWADHARLETFLVHHGPWPVPNGYMPTALLLPPAALLTDGTEWIKVPLSKSEVAVKHQSLEEYRSQLATTPRYLRAFVRANELLGQVPIFRWAPNDVPFRVIRDPVRDTVLRDFAPGGDIRAVDLAGTSSGLPAIRVVTQGVPSSRVTYQVTLHQIGGALGVVRLWNTNISYVGGKWHAITTAGGSSTGDTKPQTESVTATSASLDVPLPQGVQRGKSLVISVSSKLGGTILDQTETALVRLDRS